jgi:RNA polymerase sigma factor (sigma-70 family)
LLSSKDYEEQYKNLKHLFLYLVKKAAHYYKLDVTDDLLQEAHLVFWHALSTLDDTKGKISTHFLWGLRGRFHYLARVKAKLYKIDTTMSLDQVANEDVEGETTFRDLIIDDSINYDLLNDANLFARSVKEAFGDTREYKALLLYLSGYSYREVGEKIGFSYEWARQDIFKMKEKIKAFLA